MTILGMLAWFAAAVSLWLGARRYEVAVQRFRGDEKGNLLYTRSAEGVDSSFAYDPLTSDLIR